MNAVQSNHERVIAQWDAMTPDEKSAIIRSGFESREVIRRREQPSKKRWCLPLNAKDVVDTARLFELDADFLMPFRPPVVKLPSNPLYGAPRVENSMRIYPPATASEVTGGTPERRSYEGQSNCTAQAQPAAVQLKPLPTPSGIAVVSSSANPNASSTLSNNWSYPKTYDIAPSVDRNNEYGFNHSNDNTRSLISMAQNNAPFHSDVSVDSNRQNWRSPSSDNIQSQNCHVSVPSTTPLSTYASSSVHPSLSTGQNGNYIKPLSVPDYGQACQHASNASLPQSQNRPGIVGETSAVTMPPNAPNNDMTENLRANSSRPPTPGAKIAVQENQLEASTKGNFNWTELYRINRSIFGHERFRPGQRSAIYATLSGKDAFILLPTGGGKSLCYQLPAVFERNKVSIVVSPLVSLVHDQVSALRAVGVHAAALYGHDRDLEGTNQELMSKLFSGRDLPSLLYVTPEKLAQSGGVHRALSLLVQRNQLGRFVIDEAHCVSQWGHDFRADYLKLNILRQNYPSVPILALTATANSLVMDDTVRLLCLRQDCTIVKLSFDRPNLRYSVVRKGGFAKTMDALVELIQKRDPQDSGIVYCLSRQECEKVSNELENRLGKGRSLFYHAGIEDPRERQRRQDLWARDEVPIVCATIAFGMGIDKPHVRFVVHFSISKSLINYYQESGRAGRDGLTSDCIIFYSYLDKLKLERMIMQEGGNGPGQQYRAPPSQDRQVHQQMLNLNRMVQFCEDTTECRRTIILEYFGEVFERERCQGTCDNCAAMTSLEKVVLDCNPIVRSALDGLRTQTTENNLVRVIMNHLKAQPNCDPKLSNRDLISRVLHKLICDGYVDEYEKQNAAGYSTVYLNCGSKPLPVNYNLTLTVHAKPVIKKSTEGGKRKRRKLEGIDKENVPMQITEDQNVSNEVQKLSKQEKKKVIELDEDDFHSDPFEDENDDEEEEEHEVVVSSSSSIPKQGAVPKQQTKKEPFMGFYYKHLSSTAIEEKLVDGSDGRLTAAQQKQLLQTLRVLNKQLGDEFKVSRHWQVWSERNLLDMVARVPTNVKELSDLEEVSEEKVKRYGLRTMFAILQFLNEHVPDFELGGFVYKNKENTTH